MFPADWSSRRRLLAGLFGFLFVSGLALFALGARTGQSPSTQFLLFVAFDGLLLFVVVFRPHWLSEFGLE